LGKSAPKAPDPVKVSAAEAKASKEVAQYNADLNRIGQSSPFGSVSYTQNGTSASGAPIYQQNTTLSPELQGLLNSQIGSQQGISDAISGAIGRLPSSPFDASGINTDATRQRSFDSQMALLRPEFEKNQKGMEVRLAERGLPIGSELFNEQTGEFNRARDSAMLGAARQADQDASGEAQRLYGNAMNEYNLPLQQLSALMGNSSPVQNPTFSSFATSQAQAPNTGQNIWNKYAADQQAHQQQQSQMWGGALGLGQLGLAMFSDIRLKRDIKRIGEMASGLPVYSYRYVWSDEPQIGVMAQEALLVKPEAVMLHPSGYLMVNYGLL
jgi:hypothetical protein